MMGKFKVGDRVRCVDRGGCDFLTAGREYVLADVTDSFVYAAWDGNDSAGMFHHRFELVHAAAPAGAKFKVGDRVLMVRSVDGHMSDCPATIAHDDGYTDQPFLLKFDVRQSFAHSGFGKVENGLGYWVSSADIELIPATPAFPIEAGKFYKTRDGRKVGPAVRNQGSYKDSGFAWRIGAHAYRDSGAFGWDKSKLDLIAEWVEPAAPAAPATANDNGPKFKVGDLVKFKDTYPSSARGKPARVVAIKTYGVQVDMGGVDGISTKSFDSVEFVPPTSTPAIVALIENGTPKPSPTPKVHADQASATTEATRLAGLYRGQQFGVFVLADTRETDKPVYEHEWQNLAARGEKINAIKELRRITGLGLKPTKDAVEYWLAAA